VDVSVCIVAHECRDALLGTLAALRRGADGLAVEVCVVDNASSDGTVAAVRACEPAVTLVANGRNEGFARAANRAIRAAGGRYVLLLNPDVALEGATLAKLVAWADAHPEADVVGCRLLAHDGRVQGACGYVPGRVALAARTLGIHNLLARCLPGRRDLAYFAFPEAPAEVDLLVGALWLARRAAFERVGLLDEGYFLYGEYMDWCRRARARGLRLVHHPGFAAVHAQGTSASRAPLAALAHFHRSAVRYHRLHEAPALSRVERVLARASLGARYALARLRHALRGTGAQSVYLDLRPAAVAPALRAA
jgi:GT2 family glycosyltransferase